MKTRLRALAAGVLGTAGCVFTGQAQVVVSDFAISDSQFTITLGGTISGSPPPSSTSTLLVYMEGGSTKDWVAGSGTSSFKTTLSQVGTIMINGFTDTGFPNVRARDRSAAIQGDWISIPMSGGFASGDAASGSVTITLADGSFQNFTGETFSLYWGLDATSAYESGTPLATGIEASRDFGDAPNTYDTNLPSGASHSVIGPFLGTLRDSEADGQASPSADGDDTDGTDDEDGVVFTTFNNTGSNSIDITIGGEEAAYRVWIDFDASGTFEHPGELAASSTGGPGTINVAISVPPGADTSNPKFMRVRVYDDENVVESPGGEAVGGEVEDYEITIEDTTIVDLLSFEASANHVGTVEIDWVTGSEISTAGFNIVRTTEAPAGSDAYETTIVNDKLIPSKGNSVEGADYSFSDTPGYGRFLYQLEDLEIGGAVTRHIARRVEINPSLAIQHSANGQLQLVYPNPSGWNHEVQVGELDHDGSVSWGTLPDAPHNSGSITFDVNEGSRESLLFRVVATEQN